jgi:oligopeptide/dipeptide ABC transporter ATP-binding protein
VSLLAVHDLAVEFPTAAGPVRAVDGLSFELAPGETLALVGESGSGKTQSVLALLGLLAPPGRVVTGRAFFEEQNLLRLAEPELRRLRGKRLALVFQDPSSALHPLLTIERQLTEVLHAHERLTRAAARARAAAALVEVALDPPERFLASYPHQLSGGQRQRVLIAMALLLGPAVLFADEPTTALDVSVQAQVLALLKELQRKHGTALVFVTHDLALLPGLADRVHVLYAGRTVESGPVASVLARPLHPYTQGLLASVPRLDGPLAFPLPSIPGHPPEPLRRPGGCAFHPRCALAQAGCRERVPALEDVGGFPERRSACHEVAKLAKAVVR